MTSKQTVLIPIHEIRIVNPRSHNRITFQAITANIATVGLKKPITVHERALDDDGTRYHLICGQGRLESVRDLGDTMIPAIIKHTPADERYLMSLIETDELLKHVDSIQATYGDDVLNLTAACKYIERLLTNARVRRYLAKHHADTLATLDQLLADIPADKQRRPPTEQASATSRTDESAVRMASQRVAS
jgi:hypothetical protein